MPDCEAVPVASEPCADSVTAATLTATAEVAAAAAAALAVAAAAWPSSVPARDGSANCKAAVEGSAKAASLAEGDAAWTAASIAVVVSEATLL